MNVKRVDTTLARFGRLTTMMMLLSLCACAQYALRIPNASRHSPVDVMLPENYHLAKQRLENYLRKRYRLEKSFTRPTELPQSYFIQAWIRDSSLRYYLLEFDHRQRHLSEWKAQWVLIPAGPQSTRARLSVLELIYLGPPHEAGPRPRSPRRNAKRQVVLSDWVETPEDHLRAAVEMRRFWNESYPLSSLPVELSHLPLPELEKIPSPSQDLRRSSSWDHLQRTRTF